MKHNMTLIFLCDLSLIVMRAVPGFLVLSPVCLIECVWGLFYWHRLSPFQEGDGNPVVSIGVATGLSACSGYLLSVFIMRLLSVYHGLDIPEVPIAYIAIMISSVLLRETLYILWIYLFPDYSLKLRKIRKYGLLSVAVYFTLLLSYLGPGYFDLIKLIPAFFTGSAVFIFSVKDLYAYINKIIFDENLPLT